MSLKKDDLVELVSKDDNGWWLVKRGSLEGWAPNNYLELAPPQPKASPVPPPPPNRRAPPSAPATARQSPTPATTPKAPTQSLDADSSAKPISVFPGMMAANGSATPWKRTPSADTAEDTSRPSSSLAVKPAPPLGTKPKPSPPPLAAKPGAGKPPMPSAPRHGLASPPGRAGGTRLNAGGNLDLAAALAKRAQKIADNE